MSLRGSLLVAAPRLVDPNFARTVVLVCEHSEDGALGVILNRPGELVATEVVPDLAAALDDEDVLWAGGPVRPGDVLVLAEWDDPAGAAGLVVGDVGLVGAGAGTAELTHTARRARAFAGFAGWSAGQLDEELGGEDWIVLDADPDDVFSDDPAGLWSAVLARQGGPLALLARMPEDPSVN